MMTIRFLRTTVTPLAKIQSTHICARASTAGPLSPSTGMKGTLNSPGNKLAVMDCAGGSGIALGLFVVGIHSWPTTR